MNQSLVEAIIISVASSSVIVEIIRWIREATSNKNDIFYGTNKEVLL